MMSKIISAIVFLLISVSILQAQVRIEMKNEGGVYTTPCTVNGLKLRFIFDTGATNVSLSLAEAVFMLKNGYLNESDLHGSSYAQIANGNIIENTTVSIKELEIGGIKLSDVKATIVHNLSAPLLLGQSAIQKLGKFQMDGNELVIMKMNLPNSQNVVDYTKAIEIDPKDAYTYNDRGNAKINLQDYRGAIADYTKAIEIDPKYRWPYHNRGLAKINLQDYRGAIADYTKAIEIDPKFKEAYYNRGRAKYYHYDYKGAIPDCTKAIEIDPRYAKAYYSRGLCNILLKQKDSACLDFSKAGELGLADAYEAIKKNCK